MSFVSTLVMKPEIIFDARYDEYSPLVFGIIGSIIFIALAVFLKKLRAKPNNEISAFPFWFVSFLAIFYVAGVIRMIQLKVDFSQALNRNEALIVCGTLTNFHRTKDVGGAESFEVDNTKFKIPSLAGSMDPEYRNKSKIFEGSTYKIKYINKEILFMQLVNEC